MAEIINGRGFTLTLASKPTEKSKLEVTDESLEFKASSVFPATGLELSTDRSGNLVISEVNFKGSSPDEFVAGERITRATIKPEQLGASFDVIGSVAIDDFTALNRTEGEGDDAKEINIPVKLSGGTNKANSADPVAKDDTYIFTGTISGFTEANPFVIDAGEGNDQAVFLGTPKTEVEVTIGEGDDARTTTYGSYGDAPPKSAEPYTVNINLGDDADGKDTDRQIVKASLSNFKAKIKGAETLN